MSGSRDAAVASALAGGLRKLQLARQPKLQRRLVGADGLEPPTLSV
jgi:hypothetical protein